MAAFEKRWTQLNYAVCYLTDSHDRFFACRTEQKILFSVGCTTTDLTKTDFGLAEIWQSNVPAEIPCYVKCHSRYPEMSSGDTHRKRQTYVEAQKERKSDEHAAACGSEQNGSSFEAFLRKQRFKHTCVVSRSLCCKTELSGTMCKDFFRLCEVHVHNV